jgi:hypothetical protein
VAVLASVGAMNAPGQSAEPVVPLSAHPRLLFSAEDIPAIRARVAADAPANAWAGLTRKVNAWTDPANPAYIDPGLVANPTDPKDQGWAWYNGIVGQNEMGTILTDLAFASVVSGDPRYGRHAVALLMALADAGWPAWNRNELGEGDLTKGVGLAFDWAYDLMTPAERAHIVESLTANEANVFSCLYPAFYPVDAPGFNWQTVCGGGNGLTLLAIEGEPGAPADLADRLTVATQRLTQTFPVSIGQYGDGTEGINYLLYGLHNALPFAFAYRRTHGVDLLAQSPGVSSVARHLAFEQLPGQGENFIPRNDSNELNLAVQEVVPLLFEANATSSNDPVVGWLFDHTIGAQGDDVFNPLTHPAYVGHGATGSPQCVPPGYLPTNPISAAFCWNNAEVFTILYWRSAASMPRQDPSLSGPRSRLYPERGVVDFRTGWSRGTSEVAGSFEAKHDHRAGHMHEDIGQFTLYGYGTAFAAGSGYGHNYSCTPTSAIYEGGCPTTDVGHAVGHNVMIVDGDRFTQRPDAGQAHAAAIPTYLDSPDATVVRSDLRYAYSSDVAAVPDAGRDLLFSRAPGEPVLLAVTDHIQRDAAGLHDYEWRLHADAANPIALTGPSSFLVAAASGATMASAVASAAGAPLLAAKPWVLPAGARLTQYLITSSAPAKTARFDHLSVSAVSPPGSAPAVVSPVAAVGGSVITASWLGGEALFGSRAWNTAGLTSARLATDAELVKVLPGGGRTVLVSGTSAVVDGVSYASVTGGPGTVSLSRGEAVADGPVGAVYRLRAPAGLTSAVVNGQSVGWVQDGPDVVFPAGP